MTDVLGRILGGGGLMASTPGPESDFWYSDVGAGGITPSGERVDPNSAQKLSAWYRGRNILATVLAMLPFPVYRTLPNGGGSEPAPDHPLYDILHDAPNTYQDSFQWRREQVFHIIDHGWAYNWIEPGTRGFVHQLHPIHPRLVRPEQIKSGPNRGRYLFHVRDEATGQTNVHTQDEIFYLRGAEGKGILEFARTSLGTAMANESYAANIFGKGTLNGGYIKVPGVLDDEPGRRMALSFVTKPGEHHMPKVLEQGAEFMPNTMTPEDAQMLLSRKFSVDDMARWLGVPRQMLENSDPSFGNAEQFDESFLTYSMGGWMSLFEFAVNSQLVLAPQTYYAEFKRDAFVRGKFSERMAGLVLAAGGPILTRNEARKIENRNKLDDPKYDRLLEQQNITGKPSASAEPAAPPVRSAPSSKALAIVVESASRLLLKEVAEVQKLAVKHAADADAFAAAVTTFYAGHAARVAQWMHMSDADASAYCAGQAAQLVVGSWLQALEMWRSPDYAAGLAALAMEEVAA